MMRDKQYYWLLSSLPYLPRFDKTERLPISRQRLLKRLAVLDPEHFQLADKAAEFLAWNRQAAGRTDVDAIALYNKHVKTLFESPLLQPLFEVPINQRTILAALRQRHAGHAKPEKDYAWGVGPLVTRIEQNWADPQFKLAPTYPWITQAQSFIEAGEPLKLEHLVMNTLWNKLNNIVYKNHYGFEAVIAYLMKWDLIRQWLTYNKTVAKERFEKNVWEIINEYQM